MHPTLSRLRLYCLIIVASAVFLSSPIVNWLSFKKKKLIGLIYRGLLLYVVIAITNVHPKVSSMAELVFLCLLGGFLLKMFLPETLVQASNAIGSSCFTSWFSRGSFV